MIFKPYLDSVTAIVYLLLGLGPAVYLFTVAVFVEWFGLLYLMPRSKAFRDALTINWASAVLGSIMFRGEIPQRILYEILAFPRYEDNYPLILYLYLGLIAVLYILSVLIEGLILMILEPEFPKRQVWLAALIINAASYLILAIAIWGILQDPFVRRLW